MITYPILPFSFNLLLNTISTNGFLNGVSIVYRMKFDTQEYKPKRKQISINYLNLVAKMSKKPITINIIKK